MSRIPSVNSIKAPAASRRLLHSIEEQFGHVSNFLGVLANSPAALQAYLDFSSSLANGFLAPALAQRIAVAVAEFNSCDYSLSSNIYLARKVSKLNDAEITANRNGFSNDPKVDAAVRFAIAVAKDRGHVSPQQIESVKAAGYDDAQIIEIVQHVGLATLSNYINEVAKTEIDFPAVRSRKTAAGGTL